MFNPPHPLFVNESHGEEMYQSTYEMGSFSLDGGAIDSTYEEPPALLPCHDASLSFLPPSFFPSSSSSLSSPSLSSSSSSTLPFPPLSFSPSSPLSSSPLSCDDVSPFPTGVSCGSLTSISVPSPPVPVTPGKGEGGERGRGGGEEGSGEAERKRRRKGEGVRRASSSCIFCHRSKLKCTGSGIPCLRCQSMNRGHLCREWKSQAAVHSLLQQAEVLDAPLIGKQHHLSFNQFSLSPLPHSPPSSPPLLLYPSLLYPPLLHSFPPNSFESHVLRLVPHMHSTFLSHLSPPSPDLSFDSAVSRSMLRVVILRQVLNPKPGLPLRSAHVWFTCRKLQSLMLEEEFHTLTHTGRAARLARGEKRREEEEEQGRMERLSYYPTPFIQSLSPTGCKCLMCIEATSRLHIHHSIYSFAASPLLPLPDLDYNNHPTLIFNRTPNCPGYEGVMERLRVQFGVNGGAPPPPVNSPFIISYSVTVNRAFERLFGYSQAEIRKLFMKHEWKAPFVLLERGEWEGVAYHDMDEFMPVCEALKEQRGWEARVKCVDKWSRSFECLIVRTFMFDDEGICNGMHTTFLATRKRVNTITA